MPVYKILRRGEWDALLGADETPGAAVDVASGYVHLSTAAQLSETAAKHFAGEDALTLLALDDDALGPALVWEPSRGGALFPHLYATLRLADVVWHAPLPLGPDGHIVPPLPGEHVDPERAQFDAFKALPRDEPIEMLNLVRLRGRAVYPPGHARAGDGLSGADAYALYGTETRPILERLGARIVWRGRFQATLIGPAGESWDLAFVACYPDAAAFLAMVTDPTYREAVVHRQAAVRTSRLIRLAPEEAGASFG